MFLWRREVQNRREAAGCSFLPLLYVSQENRGQENRENRGQRIERIGVKSCNI